MAEFVKHTNREFLYEARHLTRESPMPSRNKDIVSELSEKNEIILGGTAAEMHAHYKERLNEVYHHNRNDLVTTMHWAVGFPSDLRPEQESEFVTAVCDFMVDFFGKGDPTWERNVIAVAVHRDEGVRLNGELIAGRPHIHWMAIPVVENPRYHSLTPSGRKPSSYDYEEKVCINDLIKHKDLLEFHPRMQKYLDDRGIQATVYKGGAAGERNLTIRELKEITRATGLTIEQLEETVRENERLRERINEITKSQETAYSWGTGKSWEESHTWDIDL